MPAYTITSSMTLQIQQEDGTLDALSMEPSFRENLEESIAAALGLEEEQVLVTDVLVSSRRLQADAQDTAVRRLQTGLLEVEYEVYMTGDIERNRIANTIKTSEDFPSVLQYKLETKEKGAGRKLKVKEIKNESVIITGRTETMDKARLAAKEQADVRLAKKIEGAKTSTTTSTSKRPMITMASNDPPDAEGQEESTLATTGAASQVTLQTFLVAVAFFASW
eukprot:gnl/MRDRNA2_/MRDRNA2_91964_c0_seq1.p1 gnl/MRDRNA2_/MRDRNA2_91964_c0~~gnl/MRDRNA2_/MRDRNA2_91964_c0_seq1.p1  ORF type:complete len:243 (+),score=66.96 gnl/MRDRNA2_/MRDRNA2_91964_c0_seq1:65-730(+)